ncbi:MAG TPA: hypothetical protein VGR92_02375 [Steroidobacteraceae bacterium]|nr:hypothetical protein [Steroidobacteraceae bacterium]
MLARRIVLAAVLAGCALCPPRGDAFGADTPVITRCATTASDGLRGREAVLAACSGIDLDPLLPAGWRKKASPTALADLDLLARHYAGPPPSAVPAAGDLRALARALQSPSSPSSTDSIWARVRVWLRRLLAPAKELLLKWFRSLPGGTVGPASRSILLVGAGLLILLGVAAFIFVELRAAGLIGAQRRPSSRARRRIARARNASGREELGGDIDPVHTPDRPVLALRMLVAALRRSRRIERDGGMTCRELVTRALFDTAGQREGFATVALLAERELYGPDGSPIDMPKELRVSAQALYDQLLAAPAAARAAAS